MKPLYKNHQLNELTEKCLTHDSLYLTKSLDLIDHVALYQLMKPSVDFVINAIERQDKILVFGHDDADGITSAFIFYHFIKRFYDNVCYYIPNRLIESHGIQENVVNYAINNNIDLLISLDNGLTSVEGVDRLNAHQIDTIILDHHLIPTELPKAVYVFNPKLFLELDYYHPLAGVGITYFFIKVLSKLLNHPLDPMDLFWTVLGTITDRVPMQKINRTLVRDFLLNKESIANSTIINKLQTLFRVNAFESDQEMLSFIDKISSLFYFGRTLDGEHLCFSMLKQEGEEQDKSIELLLQLKQENEQLIRHNETIIQINVVQEILKNKDYSKPLLINNNLLLIYKVSVLSFIVYVDQDDALAYPLIGRFAGQLSQQFSCPVMVIIPKEDHWAAEIRCLDGFHSLDFLNYHAHYFLNFGGHIKASGFSMKKDNLDNFLKSVTEYILDLDYVQLKNSDQTIELSFSPELLREILEFYKEQMPYGEMHQASVFSIKECIIDQDTIPFFIANDRNTEIIKTALSERDTIKANLVVTYALKSHHLVIKSLSIL